MAKIKAFKAVRPTRDKAHLVATRPYYTYKPNILAAKLEHNPFTFIHIINPEHRFNYEEKAMPTNAVKLNHVKDTFEDFCEEGILFQEKEESLYVYRQTKGDNVYIGVIAGASIDEYNNGTIKKHEATLTSREEMFTKYIDKVGFNAEPVLLAHKSDAKINEILDQVSSVRPEYEFSTTNKVKHEMWVVNGKQKDDLIEAYKAIEATYIADGHHRTASSARLQQVMKDRCKNQAYHDNFNYFLGYFIDETRLKILEFNRVLKSKNGLSKKEILEKLKKDFDVLPLDGACSPTQRHDIHLCIKTSWYKLKCKEQIINNSDPVASIDAEILTNHILAPIFDVKDLKTDRHIGFISGELGHLGVEIEIQKENFELGFVLYPVSISELKRVADNNKIMPPKSTWIEPKLRSGLTIYKIDE